MTFDSFDMPIITFISQLNGDSAFIDRMVNCIALYDTFKGMVMMALFWLVWFARAPDEKPAQQDQRQARLLIVLACSVAGVVVSRILQHVLHVHQRPVLANIGIHFPNFPGSTPLNSWNSFPSDHAMLFFALATGLWMVNRRAGIFAFLWAFFVIGLPRLYLGLHYPSDMIGGAVFGIVFMLVFVRLPLQNLAARMIGWSKAHPSAFYFCAFVASDEVAHLFDDIRGIGTVIRQQLLGY